jgi:hypothetical protein
MGARPVVTWGVEPAPVGTAAAGFAPAAAVVAAVPAGVARDAMEGRESCPNGQGEGRRAGSRGGRRRAGGRPTTGSRGPAAEVGGKDGKEAGGWGWKDLALVPCRMGKTLTLH